MENKLIVRTGPKIVRLAQAMAHGRIYATGVARALEQRRRPRLR